MNWLPRFPFARDSTLTVEVPTPRRRSTRRGTRIEARIDRRNVWFESDDVRLAASPEALAAALLVPALHARRLLHVQEATCPEWAARLPAVVAAFRDLWYPDAPGAAALPRFAAGSPAPGTALCFTGGVDSFHTLLAGGQRVDTLVYAVGYDVSLRDRRRAATVEKAIRSIAAELGIDAAVIRTNLRRHPLVRAAPWLRTFGGAIAALGHLLGDRAGRLLTSSDGLGLVSDDVGSRPDTDPLLGSATLRITHVAAGATRLEKLRALAAEPLARRHLRVCWKNVGRDLNCGACEKCVRTMLSLEAVGALGRFGGFPSRGDLVAAIDALPPPEPVVTAFYRDLLREGLPPATARAVRRLLDRSPRESAARAPRAARPRRLLPVAAFAHVFEPLVGSRVGYVRPLGNVGDDLIELAMIQLLAEFGIRWAVWRPGSNDACDALVFGGGGNMGERYRNNHDLRTAALAAGIPLTILPQSFTGVEDRPFARVYVRERESLRLCPGGILAPDLALGLAWPAARQATRDLGLFLRRDRERCGRKPLVARDPARICRTPADYLARAADHRRIVTDRLHFAIAGLHAGREVTLVANDYHKNRSMHATWLESLGCRFAASVAEALGGPSARAA